MTFSCTSFIQSDSEEPSPFRSSKSSSPHVFIPPHRRLSFLHISVLFLFFCRAGCARGASPRTWSSIWHAVRLCCWAAGANWTCFSQLPICGLLASTQNFTWPDPSKICGERRGKEGRAGEGEREEDQRLISISPGYSVQTLTNHIPPQPHVRSWTLVQHTQTNTCKKLAGEQVQLNYKKKNLFLSEKAFVCLLITLLFEGDR